MGDIGRYIGHDEEGKPRMVLFHKRRPDAQKGYIPLNAAWLFSEDHNPDFERQIMATAMAANDMFQGRLTTVLSRSSMARKMAEIATVIENGIDDLLSAEPIVPDRGRIIGDGKITINETDIDFAYTDKGNIHV